MTRSEIDAGVETPFTPAAARWPHAAWILVALVLGLLLGAGIGLLVPRLGGPADDSPEAGFARDMSTHHAQAVEMGMIAYEKASNRDVRFLGRDIALTQQGQIGMMQAWLREWSLDPTGSQPAMAWMPNSATSVRNGLMPGMATPQQMQQLRDAAGPAVDRLFLDLMIQHHLGGIHMAQEILRLSDDDQVVDMAQTAVNGQQRELTDMQSLKKQLQLS